MIDRDEVLQQITDCEKRSAKLTDWELKFVDELRGLVLNNETPSTRQVSKLDEIWERVT